MKTMNYLLSLIGAALLAAACHADSAKEDKTIMSVLDDKPVFQLKVHYFGISNVIKVNGVSVLKNFGSEGQLSTTVPVNHWMRSGENTLGITAYPPRRGESINPNGVLNIELMVTSAEPGSPRYTIASIDFKPGLWEEGRSVEQSTASGTFSSVAGFEASPTGDVNVADVHIEPRASYEGAFNISRTLHIPNALPLWAFFNSETLPDYEAMPDEPFYEARDEIFYAVYKPVQDALAAGDIDSIMPLFEERSREIDQAFYKPEGQTQVQLRGDFEEAVNSPDMELVPLVPKNVGPRREDNGKLVHLLRGRDANAIRFKTSYGATSYPIMLRRENGKWIITR